MKEIFEKLGFRITRTEGGMTIMESEANPTTAVCFVGRAKKPTWHYRFGSVAAKEAHIEKQRAAIVAHAAYKERKKTERKQAAKEGAEKLAKELKVGSFLRQAWGYTMRRVNFFEVVAIEKSVVHLRMAEITGAGDTCSSWKKLVGPGQGPATHTAKIRAGKIKLPESRWGELEFATVGQTESEWSD